MTDTAAQRLSRLEANRSLLTQTLRGIEKEGLRVDEQGILARTPHPAGLGSALTNEHVTTDYSESLLELITGTHDNVDALLAELTATHRHVYSVLDHELIWNQSMPATLPAEADIPIAWYGTSNTGMLKHVYRRGLAERYGKTMQCIAGVHYNFSLPEALWSVLDTQPGTDQDRRSRGYIGLIRNFTRYSWLLMYLFGAAPALARDFLRDGEHGLQRLGDHTLYLPYATSLRMSDLGYQNKAQSQLKLCYNDLDTFLGRLYDAVTQPWPDYQKLGTHRNGEWIQLNTNVLQIENEYYSSIRPKRATGRCERPITALAERGVQYVEVRCLDINPESPVGIDADTSRFVDAFLLFCAASDSPFFPANGYCQRSACADSLAAQRAKLGQPDATPSARLLAALTDSGESFHDYSLRQSRAHAQALRAQPLPADVAAEYRQAALDSSAEQRRIEQADDVDFDTYVARYHAALKAPRK